MTRFLGTVITYRHGIDHLLYLLLEYNVELSTMKLLLNEIDILN